MARKRGRMVDELDLLWRSLKTKEMALSSLAPVSTHHAACEAAHHTPHPHPALRFGPVDLVMAARDALTVSSSPTSSTLSPARPVTALVRLKLSAASRSILLDEEIGAVAVVLCGCFKQHSIKMYTISVWFPAG